MEVYLLGIIVALGLNCVLIAISFFQKFSTRTANFERTGVKYAIIDGSFQEKPRHFATTLFLWFNSLIIAPFFSWVHVLWILGFRAYHFINKPAVPEKVKELQYKLATAHHSKERVLELLNEIAVASGHTGGIRMPDDPEDIDCLALREDGTAELRLDRSFKQFTIYSRTDDYMGQFYTVAEYKIEGTEVISRTVEKWNEHAGDPKEYEIKDNVVLESEITEREKGNRFSFKKLDEMLAELKAEVLWKPISYPKFRYFILSRHSETLPKPEFRRFMRSESERIKNGLRQLQESIKEPGWEWAETDSGYDISFPDVNDEVQNKRTLDEVVARLSDESVAKFGIKHIDISQAKKTLAEIDRYLATT